MLVESASVATYGVYYGGEFQIFPHTVVPPPEGYFRLF
jgi:hypothetical protein